MSKYHAVRTNGYASKREAKRAWELELRQRSGSIAELHYQVPFELLPADKGMGFALPLRYVADFTYIQNGVKVIEDSKGVRTPVYRIKKRLMRQLLGLEISEV